MNAHHHETRLQTRDEAEANHPFQQNHVDKYNVHNFFRVLKFSYFVANKFSKL